MPESTGNLHWTPGGCTRLRAVGTSTGGCTRLNSNTTTTPMLIFIVQGGRGVGARCDAETRAMVSASGVRGATVRHDDSTDSNTLIVLRGVTVDR
eukprot:1056828-Rhodomonas_salina.1